MKSSTSNVTVGQLLDEARQEFKAGYSQCVKELVDRALQIDNDNEEALYLSGLVHNDLRQYARAIEDISRALAISPDRTHYYDIRINLYLRVDRIEDALSDVHQLLAINDNDSGALAMAGDIYFYFLRDFDLARVFLTNRAEIFDPGDAGTYDLGLLRYVERDFDCALSAFAKCVSRKMHRTISELQFFEYFARLRTNHKPQEAAIFDTEIRNPEAFPCCLILFFQNQIDLVDVWKLTLLESDDLSAERAKFSTCFFVGEYLLIKGDPKKAKYFLHRAANCFTIREPRYSIFNLFAARSLNEIAAYSNVE